MPRTDVPQIRSPDLLGHDEVDEKALIGLQGVVKENTARHSGSSDPAPGKWRVLMVLKPSFKPQLPCPFQERPGHSV
jgi:hypothetical protein